MGTCPITFLLYFVVLSTNSKPATLDDIVRHRLFELFSLGMGEPPNKGALKLHHKFQWNACGSISSSVVKVDNASISPDPILVPGNVTISIGVTLTETLKSPLKANVTLKKRFPFVGYLMVPCIKNFGSCTYEDLCAWMPNSTSCLAHEHMPGQCPIPAGSYYLDSYTKHLGTLKAYMATGDYHAHILLTDAAGFSIGCYEFYVSLKLHRR